MADSADETKAAASARGRGLGLSTRLQVSGHMFFARRAVSAMTRRQVRMETEPGRRQSMAVLAGVTLTAVLCIGALFWSFVRPASSAGTSRILADRNSGALYVRVGQKLSGFEFGVGASDSGGAGDTGSGAPQRN